MKGQLKIRHVMNKDGSEYAGYLRGNKPQGFGILYFQSGKEYRCEWKNGDIDGIGKIMYPDGREYTGEFQNGQKHGLGRISKGSKVYMGEFTENERTGLGSITQYSDNFDALSTQRGGLESNVNEQISIQRSGNYKNGKLDGFGIYENFEQNYQYLGDFKQDKFDGFGIEKSQDFKFNGFYENGVKTGPGIYRGRYLYRGIFKNNECHSFGIETSENGDIYEGSFLKGKKQGTGKFISVNGSKYLGSYKMSMRSGFGKLEQSNFLYVGGFAENKKHKLGYLKEGHSYTYFGEFYDDQKSGHGYEVTTLDEYKGEFKMDQRHGVGLLKKEGYGKLIGVRYKEGNLISRVQDNLSFLSNMFNRKKIDDFFGISQGRFYSMEEELIEKRGDLEVELGYMPIDLSSIKNEILERLEYQKMKINEIESIYINLMDTFEEDLEQQSEQNAEQKMNKNKQTIFEKQDNFSEWEPIELQKPREAYIHDNKIEIADVFQNEENLETGRLLSSDHYSNMIRFSPSKSKAEDQKTRYSRRSEDRMMRISSGERSNEIPDIKNLGNKNVLFSSMNQRFNDGQSLRNMKTTNIPEKYSMTVDDRFGANLKPLDQIEILKREKEALMIEKLALYKIQEAIFENKIQHNQAGGLKQSQDTQLIQSEINYESEHIKIEESPERREFSIENSAFQYSPDRYTLEKSDQKNQAEILHYFDVNTMENKFNSIYVDFIEEDFLYLGGENGIVKFQNLDEDICPVLENRSISINQMIYYEKENCLICLESQKTQINIRDLNLVKLKGIHGCSNSIIEKLFVQNDYAVWSINQDVYLVDLQRLQKRIIKNVLNENEISTVLSINTQFDIPTIICFSENTYNGQIQGIIESNASVLQKINICSLDNEFSNLNNLIVSVKYLDRYLIVGGSVEVESDREFQPLLCIFDTEASLIVENIKLIEDTGEVKQLTFMERRSNENQSILVGCSFTVWIYDLIGKDFSMLRHFNLTGFNSEISQISVTKFKIFIVSSENCRIRIQFLSENEEEKSPRKRIIRDDTTKFISNSLTMNISPDDKSKFALNTEQKQRVGEDEDENILINLYQKKQSIETGVNFEEIGDSIKFKIENYWFKLVSGHFGSVNQNQIDYLMFIEDKLNGEIIKVFSGNRMNILEIGNQIRKLDSCSEFVKYDKIQDILVILDELGSLKIIFLEQIKIAKIDNFIENIKEKNIINVILGEFGQIFCVYNQEEANSAAIIMNKNNQIVQKFVLPFTQCNGAVSSLSQRELFLIGQLESKKSCLLAIKFGEELNEITRIEVKKEFFFGIQRVIGTNIVVIQSIMNIQMMIFKNEIFECQREFNLGGKSIESFIVDFSTIYIKIDGSNDIFVFDIQSQQYDSCWYNPRSAFEREKSYKQVENYETRFSYISTSVYEETLTSTKKRSLKLAADTPQSSSLIQNEQFNVAQNFDISVRIMKQIFSLNKNSVQIMINMNQWQVLLKKQMPQMLIVCIQISQILKLKRHSLLYFLVFIKQLKPRQIEYIR